MTSPYALSDSTLEIADRFFDILETNKATLGIADVWFGDQANIPRTPAACIEPGIERRDLQGVPDMVMMNIDTHIFVYHSPVGEMQNARRDAIKFAQNIKHYLHLNHLRLLSADGLSQLTIHGFCTEFDPGYTFKQNTLYNAVQMTWTNVTKVSLQREF